mmetsp:Transcript_5264/g.12783  ORF Transcript_5264/g.12783 Transcript_5264/m.12783 type:complete len:664 (-) Transcript_5264:42-2033(-)
MGKLSQFKAAAQKGEFSRSLDLFYEMKGWLVCTVNVWNLVIDLHGKRGRVDHMQPLYREMLTYGISPNHETFEIMMEHFYDARRTDAILRVLDEMTLKHKLKPRYPTLVYALKAYAKKDDVVNVTRTFQQMLDFRMRPGLETFETVMITCARNNDLQNVNRMVDLMKRFEVEATASTFEKLVSTLAKIGEIEAAKAILNQMLSVGLGPSPNTFHRILPTLAMNGMPGDVEGFLEMLDEAKIEPKLTELEKCISELSKGVPHLPTIFQLLDRIKSKGAYTSHLGALLTALIENEDIDGLLKIWSDYFDYRLDGQDPPSTKKQTTFKGGSRALARSVALITRMGGSMEADGKTVTEQALMLIKPARMLDIKMSSATCGKVLLHLGRHVAGIDVIEDTENPTGQSNSVESSGDGNAMHSKMCQELVEILQIGLMDCKMERKHVECVFQALNLKNHPMLVVEVEGLINKAGVKGRPTVITYEELISAHFSLGDTASVVKIVNDMPKRFQSQLTTAVLKLAAFSCLQYKDFKAIVSLLTRLNARDPEEGGPLCLEVLEKGLKDDELKIFEIIDTLLKLGSSHVNSDKLNDVMERLLVNSKTKSVVELMQYRQKKLNKTLHPDRRSYQIALEAASKIEDPSIVGQLLESAKLSLSEDEFHEVKEFAQQS